ncbi:MAG: hypothetical protein M0018_08355 [Nitrospiraceae bacterium]|nr:hypothetical protein [Nitrospiraceae bacterium]
MNYNPRLLICTLYCGENEFEKSVASITAQSFKNWEHTVIKNLPNKEAHDTLYRGIMARRNEFDLFMKLDADMVFKDEGSLQKAVDLFRNEPELDNVEMVVHDWFSNSLIMGVHIYSNRVQWSPNSEDLFVDPLPYMPGKRRHIWSPPAPIVDHCPDPSPFQAYHFGVHRSLKAIQPGRYSSFDPFDSVIEWRILKNTWTHFIQTRDRRLGLALLGATQVIQNRIKQYQYNYSNSELLSFFNKECAGLDYGDLYKILAPVWRNEVRREAAHLLRVGPRRILGLSRAALAKARLKLKLTGK